MRAPAGLHLAYLSSAEDPAAQAEDVLGIATFDASPAPAAAGMAIPMAAVHMPCLPAARSCMRSGAAVSRRYRASMVAFSSGARTGCLSGRIAIDEADAATSGTRTGALLSPLQEVTAQAYEEICATLEAERYPHLLRVWNYLPDMDQDYNGTERYQQFNTARRYALQTFGRAVAGSVPAAWADRLPAARARWWCTSWPGARPRCSLKTRAR